MRKSKRIYLSKKNIENSKRGNCYECVVHKTVREYGLLKGKCFAVVYNGIKIAPNKYMMDYVTEPQIKFTESGKNFIFEYDTHDNTVAPLSPTHITLIDESGKYL